MSQQRASEEEAVDLLRRYATRGPLAGCTAVFAAVLPLVIIANATRMTAVLFIAARAVAEPDGTV